MSKRCDIQKEYYKEYGNYKGDGNYTDHYVKWLESEVIKLRIHDCQSDACKQYRIESNYRKYIEINKKVIGCD